MAKSTPPNAAAPVADNSKYSPMIQCVRLQSPSLDPVYNTGRSENGSSFDCLVSTLPILICSSTKTHRPSLSTNLLPKGSIPKRSSAEFIRGRRMINPNCIIKNCIYWSSFSFCSSSLIILLTSALNYHRHPSNNNIKSRIFTTIN